LPWIEVFAVFLVSHVAGDYLTQTEFQARNKHGGLGRDPVRRRALLTHVAVYLLCFVPALIWLGDGRDSAASALLAAAAIALPHAVQDDGRVIAAWMRRVKHTAYEPGAVLPMAVDQSFHVLALFALALAVGA
jgi:hypothetical protein